MLGQSVAGGQPVVRRADSAFQVGWATVHVRPRRAAVPARDHAMLGRLRGGHLQVSLVPPGSNRLILPVLLDRAAP
jgi:hypothetical protein